MKLAAVLAVFATITAGVSAEKCVYATVAPQLHSLGSLIAKCMTATDNSYNIARATEPPTPEQAAAICSECEEFVETVNGMSWPDCTMNMGGKDQTIGSYFNTIIGGCKAVDTPTTAPATTTPSPTVKPTTATPGSTMEAPDATSSPEDSTTAAPPGGEPVTGESEYGSASGSAQDSSDVSQSPSTSPVPSPSATSSGYTVAVGAFAATAVATTLIVVA